jgi:hypothetical protein
MKKGYLFGLILAVLILTVVLSGCLSSNPFFTKVFWTDNFSNGFQGLTLFGNPRPTIVKAHGENDVFDNMGDEWCESGAITNQIFDFSNGGVISAGVYLEVDDVSGCWVEDIIGLSNGQLYDSGDCANDGMQRWVTGDFGMYGYACWTTPGTYQGHSYIGAAGLNVYNFNADKYTNGWHILKSVIESNGLVKVYIDDVYVGESDKAISETLLKNAHVYIGGRSSGVGGKAYVKWVKVSVK